jgi:peptidoglycan/LPS O-acetylase OafA/YrhL
VPEHCRLLARSDELRLSYFNALPMTGKLGFLQVLRAVAALLVVADHALYYAASKGPIPAWQENLAWSLGTLGVDIFFVISGFIMVYTSSDLFGASGGSKNFAYRRIARIVPMYWLATAIEISLAYRRSSLPALDRIFCSLFFIPQVSNSGEPLRPVLGVGWTLNYEMFFYALFATALIFKRRLGASLLITGLAGLVVLGSLIKPLTDTSEPTTVLTFLCSPLLLLFAAGVGLGLAAEKAVRRGLYLRHARLLSLGLIVLCVLLFLSAIDHTPWRLGWQILFWIACVAIVACAALAVDGPPTAIEAGFERLGDSSYSIYLFHFIVIAGCGRLWERLSPEFDRLPFLCLAFVIASAAGVLIRVGIERPLLKTLRYLQPHRLRRSVGLVTPKAAT